MEGFRLARASWICSPALAVHQVTSSASKPNNRIKSH